jgi:predicted nucleic acid-binding protein
LSRGDKFSSSKKRTFTKDFPVPYLVIVLVKAKQAGYLLAVAPVITRLRSKGMWLTDKIISDVLRLSGE